MTLLLSNLQKRNKAADSDADGTKAGTNGKAIRLWKNAPAASTSLSPLRASRRNRSGFSNFMFNNRTRLLTSTLIEAELNLVK
jgi:hypothetical protein